MILAGDIGGTHSRLAFYEVTNGHFRLVSSSVFPSSQYASLDEIAIKFVQTMNERPDAACFGIAGPVRNGRVEATNLPWIIDASKLATELHLAKAMLINDLEASAWGISSLDAADVVALNEGKAHPPAIKQSSRPELDWARQSCTGMTRNIASRPPKAGILILLRAMISKSRCSNICSIVTGA